MRLVSHFHKHDRIIYEVRQIGSLLHAEIVIIIDGKLTFLSPLCLYQDNAIRRTRTVDSGRSRIFQYGNTLNIIRIYRFQRELDTIHQNQRVIIVQGSLTTNTNRRPVRSRLSTRLIYVNTLRTLQRLGRVGDRTILQRLRIQRGDRSR